MFFMYCWGQGKRGVPGRGLQLHRAPVAARRQSGIALQSANVTTWQRNWRETLATSAREKILLDSGTHPSKKNIFISGQVFLPWNFLVAKLMFRNWRVAGWCVRARGVAWRARARKRDGRPPPTLPRRRTAPTRSSGGTSMGPVSHPQL